MDGMNERQVHLLDYWQVLVKRRWIIYSALLLVTGLVTLGSFLVRPMYTATVQLQIEKYSPNVLPFQEVMTSYTDWRDDFYETQSRLIQSRSVARAVVQKLDLVNNPHFSLPPGRADDGLSPEEVQRLVAEKVRAGTRVDLIRNSRLANISFTSPDAATSAAVANALADAYIDFNARNAYNTTEKATESMSRQIDTLRREVDTKERALQQYAREQEIIPLDEKQNVTTQKLNDLNTAYTKAQTVRIEKEARYAAVKETPAEAIPELMTNDLLQTLTAKHAELERQYAQMSSRFKADWPAMVRTKSELDRTKERLEQEKSDLHQRLVGAAREAYLAALKEEQSLGDALDKQKNLAQEAGLRAIEYKNLKSEIENRRSTLEALVKRQTETDTTAGMMDTPLSNIRVVDAAETPRRPSSPRKGLNFLLSLVAGLGLGVGLAFFFDYMDDSINSGEDLSRATGMACLGIVPLHDLPGRRLRVVRSKRVAEQVSRPEIDLATLRDTRSEVAEAFREMRTTVLVSSPGRPPRKLLFTSSQPREGKTSCALNFAISLAQLNKRVLLVDADLRRPRLHVALELSNNAGLSNALSGDDVTPLILPAGVPNVWLLPSGPPPPNPAELLDSEEFGAIVEQLESDDTFDHIIFDSPPCLAVADAAILSARMDGVIVVVHGGATPRDFVARCAAKLGTVKARVLGGLLNMVDTTALRDYDRAYYGTFDRRQRSEPDAQEVEVPPAGAVERR